MLFIGAVCFVYMFSGSYIGKEKHLYFNDKTEEHTKVKFVNATPDVLGIMRKREKDREGLHRISSNVVITNSIKQSSLNFFNSERYEKEQQNDIQSPNTCVQSGLEVNIADFISSI